MGSKLSKPEKPQSIPVPPQTKAVSVVVVQADKGGGGGRRQMEEFRWQVACPIHGQLNKTDADIYRSLARTMVEVCPAWVISLVPVIQQYLYCTDDRGISYCGAPFPANIFLKPRHLPITICLCGGLHRRAYYSDAGHGPWYCSPDCLSYALVHRNH